MLAGRTGGWRGDAAAPGLRRPQSGEGDLLVDDELVAVADVVRVEQLARPLHLLGTSQLYQILYKEILNKAITICGFVFTRGWAVVWEPHCT